MPNYTPTPEHLAALGYAPDELQTFHQLKAYSRLVPEASQLSTLVVQVNTLNGLVYLTVHRPGKVEEVWPCYPLPTQQFFEQLLRAIGWPVGPPLALHAGAASAQLQLLRWIAYNSAEAYRLRYELANEPAMQWLDREGLLQLSAPEPKAPGAAPPKLTLRPGLIAPSSAGLDYLHKYRALRETPKNLPAFITQTTNESA